MNLQDLEARLQTLIEVKLVGALPGQKAEALIVQKLTAAMQSNIVTLKDGTRLAPNEYFLVANPESSSRWDEPRLLGTLVEILKSSGEQAGLRFQLQPTVAVVPDASLPGGEFKIIGSHKAESMAETRNLKNDPAEHEPEDEAVPDSAFLIVEGVKVFPLKHVLVTIGRRLDNTLVIDDPRVSRNHAQMRAIKGRYVLFDLNSTGGTFVNGQRANQTVLYPGDVISVAGVALIFGQDNPPPRPDLASTSPLNTVSSDRPTAVIKTMPPTKKKKK